MANAGDGGRPVQIMKMNDRKLELDVHALGRILFADHVKDKPVVVVSVAGAFRKGKSFLLNFFLRYLRNLGRADVDWMGEPEAPLQGFPWRNGSERKTTGILLWSEVFLVTTSEGEQLAVLLMDTQGTFDLETLTRGCSAIFTLSTMLSSVLIYNVSHNILEDDLRRLQVFSNYGQLPATLSQEAKNPPLQKLLFLVRDWAHPYHHSYGAEGGQKLLEERLEMTAEQDVDSRRRRQRILSCFSKIGCFLMSYPGTKVAQSEHYDGRLSDIGEDFKGQLRQLVGLVLAPDNLLVKEVSGRKLSCRDLMTCLKTYARAFKISAERRSIYEACLEASSLAAMDRAIDLYTTGMLKVWKTRDSKDREKMRDHHHRLLNEAKQLFEGIPKVGGQEYSRLYMDKLIKEIGEIFEDLSGLRGTKKPIADKAAFNTAHGVIATGITGMAIALGAVEIPAVAAACAAVGAASPTGSLCNTVSAFKCKQKVQVEACNLSALTRAKQMYEVSMKQLWDDASPSVSPLLVQRHHYRLRKTAQELFLATCSAYGVKVLPHFMERHSKEIDELFLKFANKNQTK